MKNTRSMSGSGSKKSSGKSSYDKNSPEYREKRVKNNNAVKKSRDKSKQKSREASQRVQQLQMENENLKSTVENMQQELRYLKEMLINQAGASEYLSSAMNADIDYLLDDNDGPTDLNRLSNVLTEMRRIQSMQQRDGDGASHFNAYGSGDSGNGMYHQHNY